MQTTKRTLAHDLLAGKSDLYTVTVDDRGWIDIHNSSARQIDSAAKLDFLRVVEEDEGYLRLYHFTHNEVIKGEATFTHSLCGALYGIVTDFFETL